MKDIVTARERLEYYMRAANWAGWDPFDGLNSLYFQKSPLRSSRLSRLALLQFCKRSPLNFRMLLAVPKGLNNKGLGLILTSLVQRYQRTHDHYYKTACIEIIKNLKDGVSNGYRGACWGYNFDWQARAFYQPKGTPTVVATAFIANGLLDAAEAFGWPELVDIARSSCDFILEDLNRTYDGETFCFSYSPEDNSQVYNASLLGTQLLARVGSLAHDSTLMEAANQSASFVLNRQRPDGAWVYGELPFHQWVDNFHTGFILDCLDDFSKFADRPSLEAPIKLGLDYYRQHLFLNDGTPKYYDTRTFPIDSHSAAQAILTMLRFNDLDTAVLIARWAIKNMQSEQGYFYYQKNKYYTNKIPYMRWVQAWMFRGLVALECALQSPTNVLSESR